MRACAPKRDVGRTEKLVIRSARSKLMASDKCHGLFFVQWSGQVPYSIITSKEIVIVFFHHNSSCTIVLSYAIIMIIRIYLNLLIPIYLQVSYIEGLVTNKCLAQDTFKECLTTAENLSKYTAVRE